MSSVVEGLAAVGLGQFSEEFQRHPHSIALDLTGQNGLVDPVVNERR